MYDLQVHSEFLFRLLAETAIGFFLTVWAITQVRVARWNIAAAFGGALFTAINGLYWITYAAPTWFEWHNGLLQWTFDHATPIGWTRVAGLALFALALVLGRRVSSSMSEAPAS